MMLAYRLVRLIETHSEELASEHLQKLESCGKCGSYGNVTAAEVKTTVEHTYRHLGAWLLGRSESDIETRYREIGRRRAQQGIPLSQLLWALALTKENLVDFLQRQTSDPKPADIWGELEILQALEQFFDRANYYCALGHEQSRTVGCRQAAG